MSETTPRAAPAKLDLNAYLPPDVEEVLAFRLLKRSFGYLAVFAGIVGTAFGYAGYDIIQDLKGQKTALEKQIETTAASAKDQQRSFEQQSKELTRLVTEMRESTQDLRARADGYRLAFEGDLRSMGARDTTFQTTIAQSERLAATVNERLARLEKVEEQLATDKGQMEAKVSGMSTKVDGIESFILNSGSFVVKERTQGQELHGMDLTVSLTVIRNRLLKGFTVCCRPDGKPVWGPKDLLQGSEITFDANGSRYTVRPTYVLEYFGKDAAGLDVKRSKPGSPTLETKLVDR